MGYYARRAFGSQHYYLSMGKAFSRCMLAFWAALFLTPLWGAVPDAVGPDSARTAAYVQKLLDRAQQNADLGRQDSVYFLFNKSEKLLTPFRPGPLLQKVIWAKSEQYRALGKYSQALAEAQRGLDFGLQPTLFLNQKAGIYFELNHMDSVFRLIAKSERVNKGPSAARLHYLNQWLLASVYLKTGQQAAAAAAYRQALGPASDPSPKNVFQVYYKLGNLLYDMGRHKSGLDTLKLAFANMQSLSVLPPEFDVTLYVEKLLKEGQGQYAHQVMTWYSSMRDAEARRTLSAKAALMEFAQKTETKQLEDKNRRLEDQQLFLRNAMTVIVSLASLLIVVLMVGVIRTSRSAKAQMTAQNNVLLQQRTELRRQKDDLEQLNLTKNMLLSVVTHDVRGPLGGLRMTLELTQNKHISEAELNNLLEGLAEQVTTTETLLNEVLLWAKTQMAGLNTSLEAQDLGPIIHDLLHQIAPSLKTKGVWIEQKGAPQWVMANDGILRVVLRNILANAIRHTKPKRPITITHLHTNNEVGICIQDLGPGMPDTAVQQVLGLQPSPKAISQHGLGLILVRDFVQQLQGRLEVLTTPEGTNITVWLAQAQPASPAVHPKTQTA